MYNNEGSPSSPETTETLPPVTEEAAVKVLMAAQILSKDYIESHGGQRVVNQDLIAQIAYGGIYGIDQLPDYLINDIPNLIDRRLSDSTTKPGVRDMIETYQSSPPSDTSNAPTIEEFSSIFRRQVAYHTLPQTAKYESKTYSNLVYFEGSLEVVNDAIDIGPTRIWTAGDHGGIEVDGISFHGSHEQLRRTISGNLADLRQANKVEREENQPNIPAAEKYARFNIVAGEDKMGLVEDIVEIYIKHFDVKTIVIVEDKVANIDKAYEIIKQATDGIQVLGVCSQQEQANLVSEPKTVESQTDLLLLHIRDIRQLIPQIYEAVTSESSVGVAPEIMRSRLAGAGLGFIFDHDGVISDTNKEKEIKNDNFIELLKRVGVLPHKELNPTSAN